MRWCFGRCTATPFFSRKTPDATAVDVVAPSNRSSTTTSLHAEGGIDNQHVVRPTEPEATEADRTGDAGVDEIYCATAASCPRSRGRPTPESTAIGTLRSDTPDGLSSSLTSIVEGANFRPQSRPSTPESIHCRSRSTFHAIGGDSGGEKSCARRLASAAYIDNSPTVGGDESKIPATAGAASSAAPSLSPPTSIITEKDDLLIAEIHDHILLRGVVVDNFVALGAARVCLALMISREAKLEEIDKTGLPELVCLARCKLDLSASATTCLLAQLVDSEMTAARLADPNLRAGLGGIRSSGTFCAEKQSLFWSRHHPSKEGVYPAVSGEEATQAAEAALALSEACRTWRQTIGAITNTTRGSDASSETRRSTLVSSSVKSARSSCPPGYRCCSPEPPRNLCRPPPGEGCMLSAAPTVEGVRGVAAGQGGKKQHVRHLLRQAIRVVTSGANNSYGQLVVLGYKEFSVRDSTWHRVGPKNARFILARRESPNGVQVGGRSGNEGGGGGGGAHGGVGATHNNDTVGSSPSCCQGGMMSPSRKTRTKETLVKPADGNEDDDDGGSVRSKKNVPRGRCGKQVAFKTPEARPTESCGGRNPPHRARGGEGGIGGTSARLPRNCGGSSGVGDGDGQNRGGRSFLLKRAQGESQNHAVGYRLQLSLSAQQREAAERAGRGRALTTEAPTETLGGAEDVVDVPCQADNGCDMFQLGRMQSAENDFAVRGPLHQTKPGGKVCGPVSRYAVRLLVDRSSPHRCRIFTAGFNSRKCLTLPESSPKWLEDNGEWDAVTPFGIRILKPEIGEWREVTVAGAIRRLRAAGRLGTIGDLVPGETNELSSGTIIDIGGVQMLYESAEQMARLGGVQPSQVIELLNDRQPQCPVQLQTLQFKPWKPPPTSWTSSETGGASGDAAVAMAATTTAADGAVGAEDVGERNDALGDDGDTEEKTLVPHIFPACGHVQGYAKQLAWGPCPMCRTPGPLVEIKFGWCPAIDREVPTVVFNPCGHAASLEVAERWSRLAMPNNAPPDAVYRPICPYCAKPLQCKDGERPYSKMIFVQQ
ncbi:unnamed protein product [Ectocarpus sp. 4 AP-2014]